MASLSRKKNPRQKDPDFSTRVINLEESTWKIVRNIVYKTVSRELSGYGVQDREDVTQVAMLKLLKNIGNYDPSRSFMNYLGCIIRSSCSDRLKRDKRDRLSFPDNIDEYPARENTPPITLNGYLDKMPKEKFLLQAHHCQGMKIPEISTWLDIPKGTVKSGLHRARRKAGERLQHLID